MVKENGKTIKVMIWDVANEYWAVGKYIAMAHGVIIAFDVTNVTSFSNMDKWLNKIAHRGSDDVKRILVGCKCDLTANRAVPYEIAKAFADDLGIPYIETSAMNGTGVEEAFMTLISSIEKRPLESNQPIDLDPVPTLRTFDVHLLYAKYFTISPPENPDVHLTSLYVVLYASDNPSVKFISKCFYPGNRHFDQKFNFEVSFPSPSSPRYYSSWPELIAELYVGDPHKAEGKLLGRSSTLFLDQSTTLCESLLFYDWKTELMGAIQADFIPVPTGTRPELPLSESSSCTCSSFIDITVKFVQLDTSAKSITEVYAVISFEGWLRLPTQVVGCSGNKATWNQAFHVRVSSHFMDSVKPSFTIDIHDGTYHNKYGTAECNLGVLFGSPVPTHAQQSCWLNIGNGFVYIYVGLRPEDKPLGLAAMGGSLWFQVPHYLLSLPPLLMGKH